MTVYADTIRTLQQVTSELNFRRIEIELELNRETKTPLEYLEIRQELRTIKQIEELLALACDNARYQITSST